MAIFPTCKNCVLEKQPCERRDAVRTAIVGLSITSAKLRCKEREALFSPGQRVTVTWPVPDSDDEYNNHSTLEAWPATVVKEVRSRFLIKVDDVRSDHDTPASGYLKNKTLYAKVPSHRLAALDEAPHSVCGQCGRVGDGALGEDGCYGHAATGGYFAHREHRPFGCTAPLASVKTERAA